MENVLNKTVGRFSEKSEIIQAIIIALIAFLTPTFLGNALSEVFGAQSVVATNSQIIIGSIVNTALVITALNLKGWKKIIGVVTMPSIATIMSGYVFGTASVFMAWMIPAIWLGNFALIYAFKFIVGEKQKNYFLAGAVGIVTKVLIIFGGFALLNLFGVFPEKLVVNLQNAMSVTQLITATIGVLIGFAIYMVEKKSVE